MMEEEFDETTIRRAYSQAMKLQRAGLDNEVIYARLEKQGIPEPLILRVLKNLNAEKRKKVTKENDFNYQVAAYKIGVGIIAAIASSIILPGRPIVPVGLIFGGVVLAILTNKRENEDR